MAALMAPFTEPSPSSVLTVSAILRSTPSTKVPVPVAGSANVTEGEASPA